MALLKSLLLNFLSVPVGLLIAAIWFVACLVVGTGIAMYAAYKIFELTFTAFVVEAGA